MIMNFWSQELEKSFIIQNYIINIEIYYMI